jgi:hypothetical protein
MFWHGVGSRSDLLNLLGTRGPRIPIHKVGSIQDIRWSDELAFFWSREPDTREMPPECIAVHGELREFLAWASTFVGSFRPFSAYTRVLEARRLEEIVELQAAAPALNRSLRAFVGIIMAEAAAASAAPIEGIAPLHCFSTYSFAYARAVAIRAGSMLDELPRRWSRTLGLLRTGARTITESMAIPVLAVAASLEGITTQPLSFAKADELVGLLSILSSTGEIDEGLWRRIVGENEILRAAPRQMRGNMESRIVFLESAFNVLVLHKLESRELAAFAGGLLLSFLGPGFMRHVDMVEVFSGISPSVALWYGLCSGVQPNSELLDDSRGLGRRVARELLHQHSPWSRPRADISFEEFEILFGSEAPNEEFRTENPNIIKIEVLPEVCVPLRRREAQDAIRASPPQVNRQLDSMQSSQTEMFDSRGTESRLVDELGFHLAQASRIHRELAKRSTRYQGSKKRKGDQ